MVILLYGKDTFRSREKLSKMKQKFSRDRDQQGMNLVKLDAENTEPGEIEEQIFASPFLSEKRMVIVENLIASDHEDLEERLLKKIKDDQIPDSTNLIIWEGEVDPNKKVSKKLLNELKQKKFSDKFEKFEGQKLRAWVDNKIEDLGGEIDSQALNYLVRHVGNDMWRLNNLAHQLVSFTNKNIIQKEDLDLFIKEDVDNDIFNLIDAIVEKKPKQVYNMIREQYREGNDAHYLYAMILRQFRIMYKIKDAIERGKNPAGKNFASKMNLHPYVLKKTKPVAKKYSLQQLKRIYHRLSEIDEKIKTSSQDETLLLDVFVGKLCKA